MLNDVFFFVVDAVAVNVNLYFEFNFFAGFVRRVARIVGDAVLASQKSVN